MSPPAPRPSLFIIALPRSGSTAAYTACCRLLGVESPRWAAAGEILNPDRIVLGGTADPRQRFTTPTASPNRFRRLMEYLDDCVAPTGHVYKDVVQPFVVGDWLPHSQLRVLRLDRDPADVATVMRRRGWDYPRWAARSRLDADAAVLDGLLAARDALRSVPAVSVAFEDMVASEKPLQEAMAALFGPL